MSHFDDCIHALEKALDITAEYEATHAVLELDGSFFDLYYEAEADRVMALTMVADFGDSPSAQDQGAICKQLLKAQFCFAGTGDLCFGLSNDDRFIALQGLWHLGTMSEHEFMVAFESLVQAARLWHSRLEDAESGVPSAEFREMASMGMLRV